VKCNSFLVSDGVMELRYVVNDEILSCFQCFILVTARFVRPIPVSAYQLHDNQTPDGAPAAFSADSSPFDTDCLDELENYIQDYDCFAAIVRK
jgi:hypothetical protein